MLTHERVIGYLRISLGLVFFWFGALKIAGYNPVHDIVMATFSPFAEGFGLQFLGVLETLIGLGLLFNIFSFFIGIVLIVHMLGTLSVFVLAPHLVFDPYFPILSLAGEFVFKNIILLFAGILILIHDQKKQAL